MIKIDRPLVTNGYMQSWGLYGFQPPSLATLRSKSSNWEAYYSRKI